MAKIKKVWMLAPKKPVKLNQSEKDFLLEQLNNYLIPLKKLVKKIYRIKIAGGRIYFYCLSKPMNWNNPNVTFIKPLIAGKYNEIIFARITLFDNKGRICSLDWQRYTGQWISEYEGPLNDCLQNLEKNLNMFAL